MVAVSLLAKQRKQLITIMILWIRHWGFPLASKILVIVCQYKLRHKWKFWCCTIPVDYNNTDRFGNHIEGSPLGMYWSLKVIFGMLQVTLLTWYTISIASYACHHQNDNLIRKVHNFAKQSRAFFHLAYQIWYIICQRTASKLQRLSNSGLDCLAKSAKSRRNMFTHQNKAPQRWGWVWLTWTTHWPRHGIHFEIN